MSLRSSKAQLLIGFLIALLSIYIGLNITYYTSPHHSIEKAFVFSKESNIIEIYLPENVSNKIFFKANFTTTNPSELYLTFRGIRGDYEHLKLISKGGEFTKEGKVVLRGRPISLTVRYRGEEGDRAVGYIKLYYSSIDYSTLTWMILLQVITSLTGIALISKSIYKYRIEKIRESG